METRKLLNGNVGVGSGKPYRDYAALVCSSCDAVSSSEYEDEVEKWRDVCDYSEYGAIVAVQRNSRCILHSYG